MNYYSYDLYEVEKIINCKYFKNQKYYLIKWLYYPINQSTWEPISNLKHVQFLIDEFEAQYPYTIDVNMYSIFCDEIKRIKIIKQKKKSINNPNIHIIYLSRKRKNSWSYDDELDDAYLYNLKRHLHIKVDNNCFNNKKDKNENLIIDLSCTGNENEQNINNKQNLSGLIKPIIL